MYLVFICFDMQEISLGNVLVLQMASGDGRPTHGTIGVACNALYLF